MSPSGTDYSVIVKRLSQADGGGFAAFVPDLPGCISDGATREEAVRNVVDAIASWIEAATELGMAIPEPTELTYA